MNMKEFMKRKEIVKPSQINIQLLTISKSSRNGWGCYTKAIALTHIQLVLKLYFRSDNLFLLEEFGCSGRVFHMMYGFPHWQILV